MMHADAAEQNLPQLRACPLREIKSLQLAGNAALLAVGEQRFAFELLRDVPALIAIEAEEQCGSAAGFIGPLGDLLDQFIQEQIAHPVVTERHAAVGALHQLDPPLMSPLEPLRELK